MSNKWFSRAALVISIPLVFAGCGGGVNTGSSGTEATAAKSIVSTGVVTGFGGANEGVQYAQGTESVFVNGVEYKTSASGVKAAGSQSEPMKLGEVVTVRGGLDEGELHGTADEIEVKGGITGPVAEVNASNGTMTVLGQDMTVDSNTVFEGAGGLGALSRGDMVKISGLPDSDGVILASRVEKMSAPFVPNKTEVSVVGKVDSTFGYNFRIGDLTVSSRQKVDGIERNRRAEARGTVSSLYGTTLNASDVEVEEDDTEDREDRDDGERRAKRDEDRETRRVHLTGFVTDFVSMASFKVNGTTVDASNIKVSGIANNVNVLVHGYKSGSVLVAKRIRILKNGPSEGPAPAPSPLDGAALYASKCASCHGQLGSSDVKGTTVSKTQSAIDKNAGGMGTLSNLSAAEIQAITNALARVPAPPAPAPAPTPVPAPAPAPVPAPIDGAALYASKCASCHGPLSSSDKRGTTATRIQSKHGGSNILSGLSSDQIKAIADALAKTTTPAPAPAPVPAPAPQPAPTPAPAPTPIDGAALYASKCASCHGALATSNKRGATATRIQSMHGGSSILSGVSADGIKAIAYALATSTSTSAPAPIDGLALYNGNCASCHGPASGFRGRTAEQTQAAINKNQGGMGYLSTLTTEQLQAIANATR